VHTVEAWDNASPLRSDWPTFAHSFSAAGYHTVLCGKMHFVGADQLHGFDERWTQDIYPTTFDWTRSNRAAVAVNDGQRIERVLEAGVGWTADMDYDEEVMFRAGYGLRRLARGEAARRPFLLCVSFTTPHYPYRAPQPYWDLYEDAEIELPRMPENYAALEHEYVKWLRRHGAFDRLVPDDVCRAARRAILGRITMLDDYLGRILALLRELDLEDNTIVIYTSDHGEMLGEHGLWFKNAAYEWSSRVPLIACGHGISCGRIPEPMSLLDLGPTLCSLAERRTPPGHSAHGAARGLANPVTRRAPSAIQRAVSQDRQCERGLSERPRKPVQCGKGISAGYRACRLRRRASLPTTAAL
jgi:choline-sulfatase